jgi:hypothetical protein
MMYRVGAFARNRVERKQWWDDRLWLQMVLIAVICIGSFSIVGMSSREMLVPTAVFLPVVYLLARLMLRRQR